MPHIRNYCLKGWPLASLAFLFLTTSPQAALSKDLTIALSASPSSLDPRWAVDAAGMRISNLIFHSLIRVDRTLKPAPSLAEKWKCQNKKCFFTIPYGKTFSNGRVLTSEDILFSFKEYQSKKSPFYHAFKNIYNVQIKKQGLFFHLTFQLKEFSAGFLTGDIPVLKILPKKEILNNPQLFKKRPFGTGPFELVQHDSSRIILKSRLKTIPYQKIIFKIIRDDLTLFQKILKQELDIIQSELSYSKLEKLKSLKTSYTLFQKPGLSMSYILINMKDPIFKHLEARKALALALDRKSIIKHKLKNFAEPALSILAPNNPFFEKNLKSYSYQPDKSKQILKKNKWMNLPVQIKTSSNQEVISYAKVIAYQLKQAGFKTEIKNYEWGAFYGDLKKGRFQIAFLRWTGAFDPDIYRLAFHSSEIPPYGRNRGYYQNLQLDLLLEQGKKEPLFKSRKHIYKKVQKLIANDLPIIPLWHNHQTALVKPHVKPYFLPANGSYDFLLPISEK